MGGRPTATLAGSQAIAKKTAQNMANAENHGAVTLVTQDIETSADYVIYVYNILNLEHTVNQPPLFPKFVIKACPPGQKFSVNMIPAFLNEPYLRPGTFEYYTRKVDGRKAALSLLNPSALPVTNWEAQLTDWKSIDGVQDQYGNNLNHLGVFWSLTPPDDTEKLETEIELFKRIVEKTMNDLISRAEALYAGNKQAEISPLMHFAMDYLGKQAVWHMSHHHMVSCPNCGEPVKDGIAYHKNAFGDKCIVDVKRYKEMMARQKAVEAELAETDEVPEEEHSAPARTGKPRK